MMSYYGDIYKLTNKINGKVYIGATKSGVKARIKSHKSRKTTLIGKAIRKYGIENFAISNIDSAFTREELMEKEDVWIELYSSTDRNCGYNMMVGNYVNPDNRKTVFTEDAKLAMKETLKRLWWDSGEDSLINKYSLNRRRIMCNETGDVFESIRAAARWIGKDCSGNISQHLRGLHGNHHVYGLTFKYIE